MGSRVYDVVVVGGGPSGLSVARNLSDLGYEVLLVEEDHEIGTPERCTGVVSTKGLRMIGELNEKLIANRAKKGVVTVEGLGSIEVDLSNMGVVTLNRREFDKWLAYKAYRSGADIQVSTKALEVRRGTEGGFEVVTNRGRYSCRLVVDARGFTSYMKKNKNGFLYALQVDCFCRARVDPTAITIIIDKNFSREYFFWVVPLDDERLKIGGAGSNAKLIEAKLNEITKRLKCIAYKRTSSAIVVGGFRGVDNEPVVPVGDAAGHSKPTTGGGIITGVISGGILSRVIARHLEAGPVDTRSISLEYSSKWLEVFGPEMRRQRVLRSVYTRLSNESIWGALRYLESSGVLRELAVKGDFDFHAQSLVRVLTEPLLRRLIDHSKSRVLEKLRSMMKL